MNRKLIIAIDGPAGAGKSTLAKELSKKIGYIYIDTGAMYRSITWKIIRSGIQLEDKETINELLHNTVIELTSLTRDNDAKVFLDGEDVTAKIRQPIVSQGVSQVARISEVRAKMLSIQRQMGVNGGIIMDGRDVGTVIFPDADLKFYVTADITSRANRRMIDLNNQGYDVDYNNIYNELIERDKIDSTREIAPLRPAENAIFIDTTTLSIEENMRIMIDFVEAKINDRHKER